MWLPDAPIQLQLRGDAGPETCVVSLRRDGATCEITLSRDAGGQAYVGQAETDFEDALAMLRRGLDNAGLLLGCNRFRANAFVSSLARQMSDGLGCYLVEPRTPVDPESIVSSLGSAPLADAGTEADGAAYIDAWIADRPRDR